MTYLGYEEYRAMGGAMGREAFEAALPRAEELVDRVTLNRLRSGWCALAAHRREVARAAFAAVESVPALDAARAEGASGAAAVTSFSNGVNTFGYADDGATAYERAEAAAVERVAAALPVELSSACAVYNHAR